MANWTDGQCARWSAIMMQRRELLTASAAWTAASYSRVFGANERIRIAGLGVGGRATHLLGLAAKAENTEIVAVCDVSETRRLAAKEQLAALPPGEGDRRRRQARPDLSRAHFLVSGLRGQPGAAPTRPLQDRLETLPRLRARSALRCPALRAMALVLGFRRRPFDRPVLALWRCRAVVYGTVCAAHRAGHRKSPGAATVRVSRH